MDTPAIFYAVLGLVCVWVIILWNNSRKMKDDITVVSQQHGLIRHDDRVLRLCRAIHILNPNLSPGIDFVIRHDSPAQEPYIAEWKTDAPRPSNEEIKASLQEISDVHHEEKYAALRRAEYPSVEDQLEAAYEARQGNNARQIELDEQIRRVKEKYPKNEDCI